MKETSENSEEKVLKKYVAPSFEKHNPLNEVGAVYGSSGGGGYTYYTYYYY